MAIFLLTWNPAFDIGQGRGPEPGWFEQLQRDLAQGRPVSSDWSTGARRTGMAAGDPAFLLKQNPQQGSRGIVASATLTGPGYQDVHWHGPERGLANYVRLKWTAAVPRDDQLPLELVKRIAHHTNWQPMSSGTTIKPVDESAVLRLWAEHLGA